MMDDETSYDADHDMQLIVQEVRILIRWCRCRNRDLTLMDDSCRSAEGEKHRGVSKIGLGEEVTQSRIGNWVACMCLASLAGKGRCEPSEGNVHLLELRVELLSTNRRSAKTAHRQTMYPRWG